MNDPDWAALLREQIDLNTKHFFQVGNEILRDTAAAEEVVQQALLKAWERRDRIVPNRATLRNWLTETVRTESLQRLRRGGIEIRANANHALAQPPPGENTPASADSDTAVRAALARLPEETRVVVVLTYFYGMSGKQIKEILNCSAATVTRRLHQGLAQLRRFLSEGDIQDPDDAD